MAIRQSGFTRAVALGPICAVVEAHGGRMARILAEADLPHAILEQPDLIVPLREQFRLLELAARETGDAWFGARLGRAVKAPRLGPFGAYVTAAETLEGAIHRAASALGAMLQTATVLSLRRQGAQATWSIEFLEPESEGRHHNEFLALGYMQDVCRAYCGPSWKPDIVRTAMVTSGSVYEIEQIIGTNVSHGHAAASLSFDGANLGVHRDPTPRNSLTPCTNAPTMPAPDDDCAAVASVIRLALSDSYPRADWVAAKLGLTRRSLQRRLQDRGTTFNALAEHCLENQAKVLLADRRRSVTEVALQLGYTDTAHFTRAFRRWTGMPPSRYRCAQ